MKLFDYVLSGNCYKIRLLLDFLELSHEKQAVGSFRGVNTSPMHSSR